MWYKSLHGLSIRWYPALAALLIVPVGMVRLIKYLVPFSMAANLCMLIGTGAVFYFIFIGDDQQIPLAPENQAKWVVWPPTQWSLFAGSALCSLEGVGMVSTIGGPDNNTCNEYVLSTIWSVGIQTYRTVKMKINK